MLEPWKALRLGLRPPQGWARAIREALGISLSAFARQLGMSHAGVRKLEAAEAAEVITLTSLYKLAQALDCDLRYALVPRTTLAQQRQERVLAVYRNWLYPMQEREEDRFGREDENDHPLPSSFFPPPWNKP